MRKPFARSLPVLMYHYVSEHKNPISVSPRVFEDHCRTLAAHGWRGVGLEEAEAWLERGEPLPAKSVLFTFDDGYFDNYLHAMPILARHGHRGVMFAVSNRMEPENAPRLDLEQVLAGRAPAMEEVDAPVRTNALGYAVRRDVFCNRGELRAMDAAGVLNVAAHTRGHLGVFRGPEFTGFIRPGNQQRTFFRTALEPVWGLPGFKVVPGVTNRAFLPDPELVAAIRAYVPQDDAGADRFFQDPEAVAGLEALVRGYGDVPGRYESDAERRVRLEEEIVGGKRDLEDMLGHALTSLCWPWGKYDALSLQLGREAGFRVFFTTREGPNVPGRPLEARRFKAKDKNGAWLLSRVRLYSRPLLGELYARIRL